jgi:predicted O-methyltransferase YrrM
MLNARIASAVGPIIDLISLPFVALSGFVLWGTRRMGFQRMPLCRAVLVRIGVMPVRRHYYEPFVDEASLPRPLDTERALPGIDWAMANQLRFLSELRYERELTDLDARRTSDLDYRLNNGSFESGDAEFLYQVIRARKPRRLFEIGSGHSTLIARRAIRKNEEEIPGYTCKHLCIEPYEMPWLEATGVRVLRQKVEEVDRQIFQELEENDLLFIDSSHMIRPQGDVLAEYLEILPTLRPGVIVHIHDIFSPRDYPREWVINRMWLWNEQYLLEAFLTQNPSWRVMAALNLLSHQHFAELSRTCPYLTPDREPGSFYIQKIN